MTQTPNRSRAISDSVATCSLLLTLVILVGIGLLSYGSTQRFLQNDLQVAHTYQVLDKLSAVLSDLQDAETGQRGYLLTGAVEYLTPYHSGTTAVQHDIQTLRALTQDNPSQQRRLDALQSLTDKKLAELAQTITLRQRVGAQAALKVVRTGRGKGLMDRARVVVGRMQSEEGRLLTARAAATEHAGEFARLWDVAGSTLAVLLVMNAIGFVSRYLRQRGRAEDESLRLAEAARDSALQQRLFLKDVLSSVTEGRLALCDTAEELPALLPQWGEVVPLQAASGLRGLRQAAIGAARACGYPEERVQDIATSVSEAGMNAVTHGGGGKAVICTDGRERVQVWVTDTGKGIALNALPQSTLERGYSSAGSLGHGFWLMLRMCDRVSLMTGTTGTTVVLEQAKTAQQAPWTQREVGHRHLSFKTIDDAGGDVTPGITNLTFQTRAF